MAATRPTPRRSRPRRARFASLAAALSAQLGVALAAAPASPPTSSAGVARSVKNVPPAASGAKPAAKSAPPSPKAAPSPSSEGNQAELQRKLEQERASAVQLASRESSLLGRLADLERQVELEGRSLHAAQIRLQKAQGRLDASSARVDVAQAAVDAAARALGPRLTARYQLGREGYVRFLLGARSINDLLRRKRLYSALLQADLDALELLRRKVREAGAARDELQAARDELAQSASAEQERRASLELKASVQKRALTQVQQEKGLHEQAARELEQAARALAERLRAIEEARRAGKPIPQERAEAAGAGETVANDNHWDANHLNRSSPEPTSTVAPASAAAATGPAAPAAASGAAPSAANSSAPGAPGGSSSAVGAAASPGAATGAPAAPGRKLASSSPPMRGQRGKLLFPVEHGRVEVRFGRTVDPRFGTVTLQRGLDIRAPEGSEVRAVYDGAVVHAGWFSGYGNLVILDHGDGLFSLFAHLATLAHAVGDVVERGDSLGTVGDTGSLKGPYLYFELRDGQKPLDPERWLSRSAKLAVHK